MEYRQYGIRNVPAAITATRNWAVTIGSGLLDRIAGYYDFSPYSTIGLLTDAATNRLYGKRTQEALAKSDKRVECLVVPRGEKAKSLGDSQRVYRFLVEHGFDRKSVLCILGGGVTGDLGGFVAASYLRGIDYVQIPTTLLAQVDSSLGGKVGVNFGGKKNLIGAFYQPNAIISDVSLLDTLPQVEFRNGMAEVIKYGLAMDEALILALEKREDAKFVPSDLIDIVERCSRLKLGVVAVDETERTGQRAILNFGHTLGHAVEAAAKLAGRHGEAVAVGMLAAARLSVRQGLIDGQTAERVEALLKRYGLPTKCFGVKPEAILNAIKFDKKVDSGEVRWVLLDKIGHGVVNCRVDLGIVKDVISEFCREDSGHKRA